MTYFESDDDPKFAPGAVVFNSFTVVSSIGFGGMGSVYKVHHNILDVDLALKVLNKSTASSNEIMRFQNEAHTLSKLSHTNVARVYDFGLEDGTPYLSMDFIEGCTLENYLEEHGQLSLSEFVVIFAQICSGLAHAHSRGIVHRDLKPGNIILSENDKGNIRAVIVDFGVATLQQELKVGFKTQAGAFVGSPLYSSPEQIIGLTVTPAADMYALGCMMFHALTGRPPFRGNSVLETLTMHREKQPLLENIDEEVPATVRKMVLNLLQKEPGDREWTASKLEAALDSGRLVGVEGGIAVTIPPRLRRIESNEATAARISLEYKTPGKGARFRITKKEALIAVSILALVFVAFQSYSVIVKMQAESATAASGNAFSHAFVKDNKLPPTLYHIPDGSGGLTEDEEGASSPESTKLSSDYAAAMNLLTKRKFAEASSAFTVCLEEVGTTKIVGNVKRKEILSGLAICALLQQNSKEFERTFKLLLDDGPRSQRAERIKDLAFKSTAAIINTVNRDLALKNLEMFLAHKESADCPVARASILGHMGMIYDAKLKPKVSRQLYYDALKIFKENDSVETSEYMINLTRCGCVEWHLGEWAKSKALFEEVSRLIPENTDWDVIDHNQRYCLWVTHHFLAAIDLRVKNFVGAQKHALTALRAAKLRYAKDLDSVDLKQTTELLEVIYDQAKANGVQLTHPSDPSMKVLSGDEVEDAAAKNDWDTK